MLNSFNISILSFFVGFFGAIIPVLGPASSLILHRALNGKHTEGVAMSIGTSLMEALYCGLGISVIGMFVHGGSKLNIWIRGLSSLIFLIIGAYFLSIRSFRMKRTLVQATYEDVKGSFITGMMMIALNPSIMLSWSAIAALLISFDFINLNSVFNVVLFSIFAGLGIFFGSVSMIFVVKANREKITEKIIRIIFRIVGIVLILLALLGIYSLI